MALISANSELVRDVLTDFKPVFTRCLGIAAFVTILQLAPIGYMREVYGPVVTQSSFYNLSVVTLLLITLLAVMYVATLARTKMLMAWVYEVENKYSKVIKERIFDGFVGHNQSARHVNVYFNAIRKFIISPTFGYILEIPFSILFICLVFVIHPTMGWFSLFGAVLSIAVAVITERTVRRKVDLINQDQAQLDNFNYEVIENRDFVWGTGKEEGAKQTWWAYTDAATKSIQSASLLMAIGTGANKFIQAVQGSALLAVGIVLMLSGTIPPGAGGLLIVAKLLGGLATRPITAVISSWQQIRTASTSFQKLDDFFVAFPTPPSKMPLPRPTGALRVKGASVKLTVEGGLLLRNIDVALSAGDSLLVVGPVGSGKSSFLRLASGIIKPTTGEVRLEGVNLSDWDRDEVGDWIGYLPQNVELFEGRIYENISRFKDPDYRTIDELAEVLGLSEYFGEQDNISSLNFHPTSSPLSGGQRQIVALARALYGNPSIVYMDEPSSNLDEDGLAILIRGLEWLKANHITTIVATHDRRLFRYFNKILTLKNGHQIFFGTPSGFDQYVQKLKSERTK